MDVKSGIQKWYLNRDQTKRTSPRKRARLNVARAIRTAIRAIDALSPSLGRYLQTTIRTGTFCSYEPDPRFPVVWHV